MAKYNETLEHVNTTYFKACYIVLYGKKKKKVLCEIQTGNGFEATKLRQNYNTFSK